MVDKILGETRVTTFLRLNLDKGLTWETQTDSSARAASGVYVLRNTPESRKLKFQKMVYYGLTYPDMVYVITLWGSCADSHFQRVFIIQKRVIK